jgi:quinohemoprotein amine dehydrogenase alpha subunit-like protein
MGRVSSRRFAGLRIALVVTLISALFALGATTSGAVNATQRLDLRVLVVSDGSLTIEALAAAMDAEGVPYTKVTLSDPSRPTINAAFLSDTVSTGPRGKFEAVFLPNDNPFGVGSPEMAALVSYEQTFGVRQVDAFTFPGSGVGLTTTGGYEGSLDGMAAAVTPAGLAGPFDYLNGPVTVDNYDPNVSESYGYLAIPAPAAGQTFTPLVDVPVPGSSARGSIIGAFNDGTREQLVMTIVANQYQTYFRLLTHGIISWATRDIHLGYQRNYFNVHVDDILAADNAWSPADNCTPGEPDCAPTVTTPPTEIRMTPDDVTALVNWQNANNFKLTMLFNGEESVSRIADTGSDPLTAAFLANKSQFPWISHTYSHAHLGCVQNFATFPWTCTTDSGGNIVWVDQATIQGEINNNIAWSQANGITINPSEIVTGEHSGLFFLPQEPIDNPNFVAAVNATGLKVLGADASRDFNTRPVGNANTSPRYPMSIWYNVDTKAAEVDEYNWIFNSRANGGSGFCDDNPTIATCIPPLDLNTGFDSYIVPLETRFDLQHIITNDPRVHYIHQPNLTGDRLIYPVLDSILGKYRAAFAANTPVVQDTFTNTTNALVNQKAWASTPATAVTAYLLNGQVTIQSGDGAAHMVPMTAPNGTTVNGAAFGDAYAGDRSAWISVGTTPTVLTVPNALAPTVTSLNPASLPQGAANQTVAVAGTGFATGATVAFSGTGVTVNSVTVNSATQLTLNLSVASTATLGARDVTVTNPGALAGTLTGGFTVAGPLPTVTSLSPNAFGRGATNAATTITGTNFVNGATVTVSGTGVTVSGVTFNSATSLSGLVTVSSTATTGARTVTVRNPDGGTGTCTNCLTVGTALTITSLSPTSRAQGATNQSITINGTGFATGATASFGAGITVGSVTVNSATRLTAVITVDPAATVGARTVTVNEPDGRTASRANGFTVTVKPSITSVSPTSIRRGRLAIVTVNGAGFESGARLSFSGTGITVSFSGTSGTTSVVAVVTVSSTATLGARTVTVTNPDGTVATKASGIQVTT